MKSEVWEEMAVVGRIARAHGNRGQVIVNVDTDFPDVRFGTGAELFVRRGSAIEPLRVASFRLQHERPVIALDGVETMNDAEALAGLELRVPRERLMPLPAGSYYHHDLVGCRVATRSGEEIGMVREVDASAGTARLVVEGARGEIQIPLAAQICVAIDLETRTIAIDPPPGLLDLNTRST